MEPILSLEDLALSVHQSGAGSRSVGLTAAEDEHRSKGPVYTEWVHDVGSGEASHRGPQSCPEYRVEARKQLQADRRELVQRMESVQSGLMEKRRARQHRFNSLGVFDSGVNLVRSRAAFAVDLHNGWSNTHLRHRQAIQEKIPKPRWERSVAGRLDRLCNDVLSNLDEDKSGRSARGLAVGGGLKRGVTMAPGAAAQDGKKSPCRQFSTIQAAPEVSEATRFRMASERQSQRQMVERYRGRVQALRSGQLAAVEAKGAATAPAGGELSSLTLQDHRFDRGAHGVSDASHCSPLRTPELRLRGCKPGEGRSRVQALLAALNEQIAAADAAIGPHTGAHTPQQGESDGEDSDSSDGPTPERASGPESAGPSPAVIGRDQAGGSARQAAARRPSPTTAPKASDENIRPRVLSDADHPLRRARAPAEPIARTKTLSPSRSIRARSPPGTTSSRIDSAIPEHRAPHPGCLVVVPTVAEVAACQVPSLPPLEAGTVQARLERVWGELQMPVVSKLEMCLKYTGSGASQLDNSLEDALVVWESAAACVRTREMLLAELVDLAQALDEERELDITIPALSMVQSICYKFLMASAVVTGVKHRLEHDFAEILTFDGHEYPGEDALCPEHLEEFMRRLESMLYVDESDSDSGGTASYESPIDV